MRKSVAGGILLVFALINIWSVKGMGKIEDMMVYTKLIILVLISIVLMAHGETSIPMLMQTGPAVTLSGILIVAAVTFVAYEGFQLVINAVNEMDSPERNIPRAIYSAIFMAILIYVVISAGAILAIPFDDIVQNKEYALAGTVLILFYEATTQMEQLAFIGGLYGLLTLAAGLYAWRTRH